VIKLREGSTRVRRTRAWIAGIAALAAGCVGVLALPSGASASFVQCGGFLKRGAEVPGVQRALDYNIHCNETAYAYSIVSNRQLDYFSPDTVGLDSQGQTTSEAFQCEGPLEGDGFGCHGSLAPWHHVVGQLAPLRRPCAVLNQSKVWKVWVTATVSENDGVHPGGYTTASEPFRLRTPCTSAKHRHRHRG
jgi:hypothetical protein